MDALPGIRPQSYHFFIIYPNSSFSLVYFSDFVYIIANEYIILHYERSYTGTDRTTEITPYGI